MRKIKIGILADGGDAGGGRRHILTLCKELPDAATEISFFSLGKGALSNSVDTLPNVPMETYPLVSKLEPNLPKKIREWALSEKIDILHTHGLKANMYGRLALRKSNIPIITTYHSNPLFDYSSFPMGIFFSVIDQLTIQTSTAHIAVSYTVAMQLIRRGINRNQITIIKNGVEVVSKSNDEDIQKNRTTIRSQFSIPSNAYVIGSLGRLVPVKGYDETIRIFHQIISEHRKHSQKPVYLLLVGGGEEEVKLKQLCTDLNIQDNVVFAGFQKNPKPFIQASDIMLFTPRSEALGIAILESMNAGIPVVAKKIGGIRELIINKYNGFIYSREEDIRNGVIELLHSNEKRSAFVKNGHKMIQQYFSNKTMIKKTKAVYRSFLPTSVNICNIDITGEKRADLLSEVNNTLVRNNKTCKHIVTLNIEMAIKANKEKDVLQAIQSADVVIPDGMSIVKLAKVQHNAILSRIPGIEFSTSLLQIANEQSLRVFFLGGKKEIQPALQEHISKQYPNVQIAGMQDGYFDSSQEKTILETIQKSQADILFVALGMGKQETFIAKWKPVLSCKIAIGVGGSFDVWAGTTQRSPQWWIDHNLEWLYRICKQPKERFYRIVSVLPSYFAEKRKRIRPARVVLSGYYGFGNIGDEAILRTLMRDLNAIQAKGKHLSISVLSSNPYSTSSLTDAFAIERFSLFDAIKEIWRSDALISGGGGLIQDVTSFKSPLYYLGIIQIARLFRKPVLVYANGIGPLSRKSNQVLCRIVLNQVNTITVRDEASKIFLKSIGVQNVEVTIDPIFSLNPEKAYDIDSYPHYKNYIAVCFGPNKHTREKTQEIAQFLDYVSEKSHLPIVFTPFYPEYDKRFSKQIQKHMKHETSIIDTFNTPEDMLSLLRRCSFGIGMRLHFMILLSLLNKPILPFTYDPKVTTFASILHLQPMLTSQFSLDQMKASFDSFLKNSDKEAKYQSTVQLLRNSNKKNVQALEDFISHLKHG